MEKKFGLAAFAMLFALLSLNCLAHEITVKTDKAVYGPLDEINITSEAKNTAGETKGFVVETEVGSEAVRYYPSVFRSGGPFESGEKKKIPFKMQVAETMPAGQYFVKSFLMEEETVLAEATAFFEVKGTLSIIDVDLLSCRDAECNERAKLFHKGETVYLGFQTAVEDLGINATLVLPDGTEKSISLPSNHSIDAAGAYLLKVSASKEGYKTVSKQMEFGALEEEIKVIENKPISQEKPAETAAFNPLIILAAIAVIVIVAAVFFAKIFKKR